MIRVRNRAGGERRDGSIRLVANPGNNVRRLMVATKFDGIFPVFDTMAAARRGIVFTDEHALPETHRLLDLARTV